MRKLSVVFAVIFAILAPHVSAYKILCLAPTMGKSHWIVGSAICKVLAGAGHEVTMISPFPLKNPPPNYHDIELTGLQEIYEERMKGKSLIDFMSFPPSIMILFLANMGAELTEFVVTHKNVVTLMESGQHFDLVITELFCTDALLGFGQHFNAPVVAFSSFGASLWTNDVIGNPAPLSTVPHFLISNTNKMSFTERFHNAVMTIIESAALNLYSFPKQAAIYEKYFPGDNKPSFNEIYKKGVSLVLLNSHFSLSYTRPYLPNMIEIGGIQLKRGTPNPLPKNIKEFIESAEHGVIYFSMGSGVKSADFPDEKKQAFLSIFGKLKQKVIWKYEEELPNKPKNVLIDSWLPQGDILAHPNIKLFITHGGLLGTTEAIYNGVPIVGIPIFGDQLLNVARAEKAGWGLKLAFTNLTETSISSTLNRILSDQSFADNMKIASERYRDQPMTPAETAVYWVEYVIRHKGAAHIQSSAQDLNFIQYHMLDVFVVLAVIVLTSFAIFLWMLRKLYNRCVKRSPSKSKSSKGAKYE